MSCSTWREGISAMADGETPGVDPELIDAHVERCPSCAAFSRDVHVLRRSYAMAEADRMPDLAPRVARLDRLADRLHRWGAARVLLAVVAIQIMVLSIPQLVVGDGTSELHGSRHLGAFTLAYGAGLLLVVWRPARARSILPVATTLAAALLITAVVDIATGNVPFAGEVLHLPELASVGLIWALTIRRPRRRPGASPAVPDRARLRAVGDTGVDDAHSESA